MALIRIHADGTFETAHVEATAAVANVRQKLADAKAKFAAVSKDHRNAEKIDALRETRERVQQAHKAKGMTGPRTAAAHKARIDKINGVIKTLTSQMSGGKYVKPAVLTARLNKARAAVMKYVAAAKPGATRTPRVPKDHAAAFNSGAKRIAGTVSRGIRSELRDHGKTALVPVANRPGAKAPVAKPSGKKADTATKHATKPSRGAIGNTLAEIKAIKARIATGELKGAKLIRAREELEKQREALRGLRAGKSPANQRSIVKPGAAKHMGGAKKIVGKPSGMGDASANKAVATLTKRLEAARVLRTAAQGAGNKAKSATLLTKIKELKAQIAAAKKAK